MIQDWTVEVLRPFPRGLNYEIAKIHWQNLNIFLSRTTAPISTKLIIEWRGFKFFFTEGPCLLPRNQIKKYRNTLTKFKNILLLSHCAKFNHTWHRKPLGKVGFKFFQIKNYSNLKETIGIFSSPNKSYDIIVCVYWFEQVSDVAHVRLVLRRDLCWFTYQFRFANCCHEYSKYLPFLKQICRKAKFNGLVRKSRTIIV